MQSVIRILTTPLSRPAPPSPLLPHLRNGDRAVPLFGLKNCPRRMLSFILPVVISAETRFFATPLRPAEVAVGSHVAPGALRHRLSNLAVLAHKTPAGARFTPGIAQLSLDAKSPSQVTPLSLTAAARSCSSMFVGGTFVAGLLGFVTVAHSAHRRAPRRMPPFQEFQKADVLGPVVERQSTAAQPLAKSRRLRPSGPAPLPGRRAPPAMAAEHLGAAAVTEAEVEAAVEEAERLSAEALAARELAEELSVAAEQAAESAEEATSDASETLNAASNVTVSDLSGASKALDQSLDAGQAR